MPDIGVLHSVRLGRAVDNDLVVADVTVSKVHARIDAGVDGLWVCDLGSRNGSKLRGQALTVDVPRSFVVGDELGFGSTRFIVVDAAACWALIRQQLEV